MGEIFHWEVLEGDDGNGCTIVFKCSYDSTVSLKMFKIRFMYVLL